jgi:hypothetical protein
VLAKSQRPQTIDSAPYSTYQVARFWHNSQQLLLKYSHVLDRKNTIHDCTAFSSCNSIHFLESIVRIHVRISNPIRDTCAKVVPGNKGRESPGRLGPNLCGVVSKRVFKIRCTGEHRDVAPMLVAGICSSGKTKSLLLVALILLAFLSTTAAMVKRVLQTDFVRAPLSFRGMRPANDYSNKSHAYNMIRSMGKMKHGRE